MIFLLGPDSARFHGTAHEAVYTYVLPAVVALIGPALTALAKMSLDLSRTRRSDKLAERITKLCEQIRALPEFAPEDCMGCTPRQALVAEMNVAIQELSELQQKKHATIRFTSATITSRVRSLLLLFRPHGFRAWLVQLTFWSYCLAYIIVITFIVSPSSSRSASPEAVVMSAHPQSTVTTKSPPAPAGITPGGPASTRSKASIESEPITEELPLTRAEDTVLTIVAAAVLSIPCLILNVIGNGIRRKRLDAIAKAAAAPTVVTTVTVQGVTVAEQVSA